MQVSKYTIVFLVKGCNNIKGRYRENFVSNLSILSKRFNDFKICIYPDKYKIFTEIPCEYISKDNFKKFLTLSKKSVSKVGRNLPLKKGFFIITGNIWDLTEENLYYTLVQLHRLSFYAPLKFKFISEINGLNKEEVNLSPEIEEKIDKMIQYDNELLYFINEIEKSKYEPCLWGKRIGTIKKECRERISKFSDFVKLFFER